MERLILQNQLVMLRALLAVVTTSEVADALRGAIDNTEMAISVWRPTDVLSVRLGDEHA